MHKFIYVDEQKDQRDQFLHAAFASSIFSQNDGKAIGPERNLDPMIKVILEFKPRALIADHRLHEFAPGVEFNGVELIKEFQRRYIDFPCFILTSYSDSAAKVKHDVNLIFSKEYAFRIDSYDESELSFFQRVDYKIKEYEKLVNDMERDINKLMNKSEPLTTQEVDKLIELDNKVEKMLWAESNLSTQQKKAAIEEFPTLINSVKDLVADIKQEIEDSEQKK